MPYINVQQLTELDAEISKLPDSEIDWKSVSRSHTGKVRSINEDAFLNSTELGLWVVADGMGGHSRGDYASKVVVESLVHFLQQKTLPACIIDLEVRLRRAHENCRNSFNDKRVGSTVAALFSYGGYAFFLWAGDSRIYRLRDGQLEQMTVDHTVAQQKVGRGELSPARAALHPSAHILTRAVGVHQTLHLDLDYAPLQNRDRFLICSDGLYNELPVADIQTLLEQEERGECLTSMVDRALDRGGRDNITAVICDAFIRAG